MTILTIEEPEGVARQGMLSAAHPVWRLGFRPFYLLAALFAALSVPLWVAQYYGLLPDLRAVGLGWHMHEMVFGMAIAVIVGFLFTAGRNWTGLPTPTGRHLAALAGLWLAGRVAMLFAGGPLAAVVDLAFLPLAAWPLAQVLYKSGNKRNLFLVGLLGALALANGLFHAAELGWLALSPVAPIQTAILIIVIMESVIGARVIPMFTTNGAPGSKPRVRPRWDRATVILAVGASVAWTVGLPAPLTGALALAAGAATMVRLIGWQPQRTLQVPLLWILHLSYGWIGAGYCLLGLAALGAVSASAAFHALAVGSMAGLIVGMMTRTTLGHTGRMLKAGRAEVAMYALIQAGAVARLAAALGGGRLHDLGLVLAAACWSLAFLLYAWVYAPYLTRARVDGREG